MPVDPLIYLLPTEKEVKFLTGIARVLIWTSPPPKPKLRSGDEVLWIMTLSIRLLGTISNSKSRTCTSVLGRVAPSIMARLYRSAIPRITTRRLSLVLTPEMRFKVSPTFLSGKTAICSRLIPLEIVAAFFCLVYKEAILSCL
ncbi:hypothetical protein D3C81_1214050 [compost metagenome]